MPQQQLLELQSAWHGDSNMVEANSYYATYLDKVFTTASGLCAYNIKATINTEMLDECFIKFDIYS